MIKIAVGASGSAPGFFTVRSLLTMKHSVECVIALDLNPSHLVPASQIADRFAQVPAARSECFIAELLKVFREHEVSAYIPIHDEEIRVATANVDKFTAVGIKLVAPSSESVALATNKLEAAHRLARNGVNVPNTSLLCDRHMPQNYPLVLKPVWGVGSAGVKVVTSAQDFARQRRILCKQSVPYVAQEFIGTPEITVDAFVDPLRQVVVTIARERLEIKAGVTTKARVYSETKFDDLASRIAHNLGLVGVFCFQLRTGDPGRKTSVIDVNPRVGGATAMSVALGPNFALANTALHLGRDYTPYLERAQGEVFVSRTYAEHFIQSSLVR